MPEQLRGEVISLASRRHPAVARSVRIVDRPARHRSPARPMLALAVGALLLILAVAAGTRSRSLADIRALSAPDRARMFGRALEDLKTSCPTPERVEGALRDHCRAQAEFVRLFPECDRACQSLAAAVLPHAKR